MELLVVGVLALLAIGGSGMVSARFGIAAPLVLVVVGIVVSLVPVTPEVRVDPEWILAGVLPPLLYAASASLPAMNFRREFAPIGSLSVVLVVLTSVAVGFYLHWVVPGLALSWGIALGAIISPTDAVATSIARRVGVSSRVMAMLEGESLLNDATALVLLRTAIAAVSSSFSFWTTVGRFAWAVAAATVIGVVVSRVNLRVRARTSDATVNTVLSFTVPFLASVPAQAVGASGLVAAVAAGIVTGRRGPRLLSPLHRLSDTQNWRTVELVLEGAVFLLMGLELSAVLGEVGDERPGVAAAVLVAGGALVLVLAVRALYVAPLVTRLRRRAERRRRLQSRLAGAARAVEDPRTAELWAERFAARGSRRRFDVQRWSARARRMLADIEYFLRTPLGWRDGGVLVWAGMRGAVTVAAAQTLPDDTPHRSLLVLVAFAVATLSLLLQGGTLAAFVRWIRPTTADPEVGRTQRAQIQALLDAVPVPEPSDRPALARLVAQRSALLDARDEGAFDADALAAALAAVDAQQIVLELQDDPAG
ncbi:cation:proton antiporter [Nakamurella endophytica]|uniref:Peptidase n=1 Tax=Nakamurella endophytica TaxID=1748367 RepID=A0A917SRG1_9ACTN|nr:sodium:proton antiporter [Nakamurella endophytica]GGL92588.1 peptidase [Nakamurella endophytica]